MWANVRVLMLNLTLHTMFEYIFVNCKYKDNVTAFDEVVGVNQFVNSKRKTFM